MGTEVDRLHQHHHLHLQLLLPYQKEKTRGWTDLSRKVSKRLRHTQRSSEPTGRTCRHAGKKFHSSQHFQNQLEQKKPRNNTGDKLLKKEPLLF